MTIKAIILDISGTVIVKKPFSTSYTLVPGIQDMISRLENKGIEIFVASNEKSAGTRLKNLLNIQNDKLLYPQKVGGPKGTRKFVEYVCSLFNLSRKEILYLGDSDNDRNEAINSNVAFFLAVWSNPEYKYGIPVEAPSKFAEIVEIFFLKEILWYYKVNAFDKLNRGVVVRSLLDPDRAEQAGIKDLLKSKGMRGLRNIGSFKSDEYLSFHLLASIYLEGLYLNSAGEKPIWCLYPGHDGDYTSVLSKFITMIARLFREKYVQDLILRHTPSIKSSAARARRNYPKMDNQLQTIHLNPAMKNKIEGQSVIVIDDFTTYSQSFETARNFLLNANAKSVACIAIGKYPIQYDARSPKFCVNWNSFEPCNLTENDFDSKLVSASTDISAISLFEWK